MSGVREGGGWGGGGGGGGGRGANLDIRGSLTFTKDEIIQVIIVTMPRNQNLV